MPDLHAKFDSPEHRAFCDRCKAQYEEQLEAGRLAEKAEYERKEKNRGSIFVIRKYDEMGTPRQLIYSWLGPNAEDQLLRSGLLDSGDEVTPIEPDDHGGVRFGRTRTARATLPPVTLEDKP